MGGRTQKIVVTALIGLLFAGRADAEAPSAARAASRGKPASGTDEPRVAADGTGAVRLGEVRITGTPEHPGVLFFLPRTRFHLLPPGQQPDWREELLREDREKGALSR